MGNQHKYTMRLSLQVLEHLGFNLYSNIPAVLSEVVANSWDADADSVSIDIGDDTIIIQDDGNGMSLTDVNDRFLYIGYKKRNETTFSPKYQRPVMGRKGIGKLSLFSIAKLIEIHTVKPDSTGKLEKNGFILNRDEIIKSLENPVDGKKREEYYPVPVDVSKINIEKGTRIHITEIDKNVNKTEHYLRRRLARRFSIINDSFKVEVNKIPITLEDRDYFSKVQFLWLIGDQEDIYSKKFSNIKAVNKLAGNVKSLDNTQYRDFKISGWIGTVEKPADLGDSSDNLKLLSNNKISIITRGKLSQEDILKSLNESGVFATYLIGEVTADALDDSSVKDIATSSRQSIKEDDIRYQSLLAHLQPLIKDIKRVWTDMRKNLKKEQAIAILRKENPVVLEWFETLKGDSKDKAKDLFATIESFHFDDSEELSKKKELYKQGIVAFEKLRLQDELSRLDKINSASDIELASIFATINDLEANSYYDIATERVKIIRLFNDKLTKNELEKRIQEYLFDNLWLLNPSWERATRGTELMEQKITTAFGEVDAKLTEAEGKGRFDIRYRTNEKKHIIVELKRYDPSYKIDSFSLAKQASKYKSALAKCLHTIGEEHPYIEVIVVLGEKLEEETEDVNKRLRNENARLIYYDELVAQSLESYSIYLEKHKDIGKLRSIISKI